MRCLIVLPNQSYGIKSYSSLLETFLFFDVHSPHLLLMHFHLLWIEAFLCQYRNPFCRYLSIHSVDRYLGSRSSSVRSVAVWTYCWSVCLSAVEPLRNDVCPPHSHYLIFLCDRQATVPNNKQINISIGVGDFTWKWVNLVTWMCGMASMIDPSLILLINANPAPLSVIVNPSASSDFTISISFGRPFRCAKIKSSSPIWPPSNLVISTLCEFKVQKIIWNCDEIERKDEN